MLTGACSKCGGTVYLDKLPEGDTEVCVNCGKRRYLVTTNPILATMSNPREFGTYTKRERVLDLT